ncbi:60S acidic ribosomal protein P2 isoform X1 [Bombus affinis]|uniref:Large ribosomal subunit protein P2 n=3 Tax=Bombus TaxID=144708 RepID=A0A9B0C4H0_BOMTE|nr:60S acidic ribosomal protein P2 [Bombus terrestris]XP_050575246.1 60S acidic ribosomal protein P2 isoform X1 [Bombus affinis]AEO51764.1 RPP2 [Bombus hypocrita]
MRYVAAYLLATLGGKASPSQNDIEKILSSVGIEADTEKLKKVISELNGKSVDELIAQGMEKLLSMPVGGGVAVSADAAPAGGAAAPAEEKKEEKKPAKEESESEDDDMGFGLFD